jgi:hypothetical protein
MNSSNNFRFAIGADFEPRGNEGRLQFAWSVVTGADDQLALAEGWSNIEDLRYIPADGLLEASSPLTKPVIVRPPQGLIIVGPHYFDIASSFENPVIVVALGRFRQLVEQNGAFLVNGGHWCLPATYSEYRQLAETLAVQAKHSFDHALQTRYAPDDKRAEAALTLFEAEPLIKYEDRLFRRLLYLRAARDVDGYLASLEIGSSRLQIPPGEIESKVLRALDILRENLPFEQAIKHRAEELLSQRVERVNIDFAADEKLNLAKQGVLALGQGMGMYGSSETPVVESDISWEKGALPKLSFLARARQGKTSHDIEEGELIA